MERNSDRFATVDKSLVHGFEPDRVEPERVLQAEAEAWMQAETRT